MLIVQNSYYVSSQILSLSVPAGYPRNFSAIVNSPRSVSLKWNPVLPEERNGIITGYIINITAVERGEAMQLQSQSINITVDVYPYTSYTFIIAATTSVGSGPYSTVITVRTPPEGRSQNEALLHMNGIWVLITTFIVI